MEEREREREGTGKPNKEANFENPICISINNKRILDDVFWEKARDAFAQGRELRPKREGRQRKGGRE